MILSESVSACNRQIRHSSVGDLLFCSVVQLQETNHTLTLNLSSMKIWCYACSLEVFRDHSARPHV